MSRPTRAASGRWSPGSRPAPRINPPRRAPHRARRAVLLRSVELDPGQLVLVVVEVAQLRAGDRGEPARCGVVGRTLELDRAYKPPAGAVRQASARPMQGAVADSRRHPRTASRPGRARRGRGQMRFPAAARCLATPRSRGASGALSTLTTCAPSLLQRPAPAAGAAAEVEAESRPAAAAARSRSAPPIASDRRGSAARYGLRQTAPRRWETNSCRAPPPRSFRHRARSTSRAVLRAAARRTSGAAPKPWAIAAGSAPPGDAAPGRRPPNCAGSRATALPHPKSRRSGSAAGSSQTFAAHAAGRGGPGASNNRPWTRSTTPSSCASSSTWPSAAR